MLKEEEEGLESPEGDFGSLSAMDLRGEGEKGGERQRKQRKMSVESANWSRKDKIKALG